MTAAGGRRSLGQTGAVACRGGDGCWLAWLPRRVWLPDTSVLPDLQAWRHRQRSAAIPSKIALEGAWSTLLPSSVLRNAPMIAPVLRFAFSLPVGIKQNVWNVLAHDVIRMIQFLLLAPCAVGAIIIEQVFALSACSGVRFHARFRSLARPQRVLTA